MLQKRRVSIALVSVMTLGLLGFGGAPAKAEIPIPETESNLFILDVSGSVDTAALWQNLRVSIIAKLEQPFGSPILTQEGRKQLPVDISVTSVSENSANSPLFRIVSTRDSEEIWGAIDLAYPKPPKAQLEKFDSGFFGDKGVWVDLIKIFEQPKIIPPSNASCYNTALRLLNSGDRFLAKAKVEIKQRILGVMCDKLIKIAINLKAADEYFAKPLCKNEAICSDIIGAVYKSTSLAADLVKSKDKIKPGLCIAIASDMLHFSKGMSKTSDFNSKRVAETALTVKAAKDLGYKAARAAGVKFPSAITTRVAMIGIGSGPDPISLERNSYLLAYWEGFWVSSGVKVSNQGKSLDKACS